MTTSYFNAFPIVYTEDLERALAFYRDLLGFRQTFQFPADGDAVFVSLELEGGGSLALAAAADGQTGAHGRVMRPLENGSFEMCVYTTDVDSAVTGLSAHGVEVLVQPVDQPWGERMAYVADPDGRPIMICARL